MNDMQEVGTAINVAMAAFRSPMKVNANDLVGRRACGCGGSRAIWREHWDGITRIICIDCSVEVGRATSGQIG